VRFFCVKTERWRRRRNALSELFFRGAMRELVINWCDSRTFYNDPKFLRLIDFDFELERVFVVRPPGPFAWLISLPNFLMKF
jgi:hypothetical protein